MKSLNVLLVTYTFPPPGGVGVLRAASLARYLPTEAIRLDVLTTRNASAVGADPTLLDDIPADVSIHRTITLDLPFGIKKALKRLITRPFPIGNTPKEGSATKSSLLRRALQEALLPDPQVTWLPVLTRVAHRIIKNRHIDLVLITAPPFSSLLLVERLRKEFPRLVIVIDFRDEWLSSTIKLVSFSSSKRAIRIAHRAEASCVKSATTVVAVTEAARLEIRNRYPDEPNCKFQLIPNGFDATRLHRSLSAPTDRSNRKIIVTYVGTVYTSSEPGVLVLALRSMPPEIRSRFTLRFIGHIEEPFYREALLQLGNMVDLQGYLPQHEALAAMSGTDYALLISHDHLNIPAKFYDYIGAGKPILACVHPQGDVRRLLDELRAGWWADSRDVEGIRQLFLDAAARSDSLQSEFQPDVDKIAQYERKILAHRYAELLHSIAGRRFEDDLQLQHEEIGEEVGSNA